MVLLMAVMSAWGWYVLGHYLSVLDARMQFDGVPEGLERYADLPDYQSVW